MCPSERYTHRRGRSGVPSTLVRTRAWTRWRCKSRDSLRTRVDATVSSPQNRRLRSGPCYSWPRTSRDQPFLRGAGLCSRLAGLLLQPLTGDAHALLLVGVGRTQRAHIRGNLADLAFVRAAHDDVRLLLDGDLNAFRNRKFNRVRLAEREGNQFALQLGAIADAHDVELFLETGGHAVNGVGNQRAREAMKGAVLFGRAKGSQHAILLFKGDALRDREGELALRPLHVDFAGLHGDLYACRHWNWFASDS